jgi:hypothetical protein
MFAGGIWMLDLTKVAGQVRGMAEVAREYEDGLGAKLRLASSLLSEGEWRKLAAKVRESKTSWLTAQPTEQLTAVHACPSVPSHFSVAATDGSQITPDHHGPALCYLLNLGSVLIHYGSAERPKLSSEPSLYFEEADLYWEMNGKQVLVQGELLAAKRSELEAVGLAGLLREGSGRRLVALEDGSLIKWNLEQGAAWQEEILNRYLKTLSVARELKTPLCGYLSGSRACDVVNMLRVALCPENPVNCDHCPYKGDAPCKQLDRITDTTLFRRMLRTKGERSQVFTSASKVLDRYGEHKVGFFYLNVGTEIARVELPAWVWQEPELLDLAHTVIVDQVNKGGGYPVVLTEAHEQAVVKGADRDAFFRLVEGVFVRQGIPVLSSSKSIKKRVPTI